MTRRPLLTGAAILALAASLGACAWLGGNAKTTAQGWKAAEQDAWYAASQGSRLMPLAWFKALEQPGGTAAFSDESFIKSFGYIGVPEGSKSGLPVGFVVDRQADDGFKVTGLRWYAGQPGGGNAEPWIGLNCSACHTAEVSYQGKAIRVDGGPGLGDYQSFIEALDQSLRQTRDQPDKWDRFASKVLTGKDTPANRDALKAALGKLIAWEDQVESVNHTPLRYGFARVDAFGHIYNKVALFNGAAHPVGNPADAPVSYPFLWDLEKQDRVQWDGVAKNSKLTIAGRPFNYGALGRNAGEVIGVFGEVIVKPPNGLSGTIDGFPSSLQADNLNRIEDMLMRLESPKWPDAFPQVDKDLAAKGAVLFDAHCAGCHMPKDKWQDGKGIEHMISLRSMAASGNLTDIWMACNAFTYTADTGNLEGQKTNFLTGETIGPNSLVVTQLATTVEGALVGKKLNIAGAAVETFLGIHEPPKVFAGGLNAHAHGAPVSARDQRRAYCLNTTNELLAYKARPLDGIWATAPYLHNGSVPTLYHLLLPGKDRPKAFWLGSREFDPKNVGYVWEQKPAGPAFQFQTVDAQGQPRDGDSNLGHEYGADKLTDAERWALVEYMKTL